MIRPRAVLLALALVVACGPVSSGGGTVTAQNQCSESPCTAYTQAGNLPVCTPANFCQALNSHDFTVVVTVPDSSVYAPGTTFIQKYGKLTRSSTRCFVPAGEHCIRLPSLGEFAGSYTSTLDAASKVGFALGFQGQRSVPAQASFRPAWTFVDGASQIDVGLLGLELQPIIASPVIGDQGGFPAPSFTDTVLAPTPSVGFDALLPLTTDPTAVAGTPYAGQFEETLAPTSPFDRAFPPVILQGARPLPGPLAKRETSDFQNVALGASPLEVAHPITVTRGAGLSLEGWTLYLRDERTLRRISSAPTLQGPAVVKIFTAGQADPKGAPDSIRDGVELVLTPPPGGPHLPDLVLTAIANAVPPVAPYPLLPPLVIVQGLVAGADGASVRSDVVLVSDEIAMLDSDLSPSDLRLVDQFSTNDDGTYERLLPAGKYKAIVTPVQSSGYAKTLVDLDVAVPTQRGSTTQGGKKLEVVQPVLIHGNCVATDGRVMANVEVEAHASSSLLYALDPTLRDPKRWPRTARAKTDPSGDFVLVVDPGGIVDVVVRPDAGTNFPWVVVPQVTVPASSDVPIAPLHIQVPVPYVVSVGLHDPSDNPVAGALVQAFVGIAAPAPAQVCDRNNGDPAAKQPCPANAPLCSGLRCLPMVAVEVGRARTDVAGRFVLFLDGFFLDGGPH